MGRDIDTKALSYGRELAVEREIAEETAPRTLTEDEAYAIVADRVRRETADLTAANETLTREKADLATQLETTEAKLATEQQARELAEAKLVEVKEATEREQAAAARLDDRFKTVREAAFHLKDEFFTDERKARWSSMEDEAFTGYVAELAQMAEASGVEKPALELVGGAPRETAMHGTRPVVSTGRGKLAELLSKSHEKKGA